MQLLTTKYNKINAEYFLPAFTYMGQFYEAPSAKSCSIPGICSPRSLKKKLLTEPGIFFRQGPTRTLLHLLCTASSPPAARHSLCLRPVMGFWVCTSPTLLLTIMSKKLLISETCPLAKTNQRWHSTGTKTRGWNTYGKLSSWVAWELRSQKWSNRGVCDKPVPRVSGRSSCFDGIQSLFVPKIFQVAVICGEEVTVTFWSRNILPEDGYLFF